MEKDKTFFENGVVLPQVQINGLSLSEFSDRVRKQLDEDQNEPPASPEK